MIFFNACRIVTVQSAVCIVPFSYYSFIFQGNEGRFSVYVHASKDTPVHFSRYFVNREIRSDKVCFLLRFFSHIN